jgi:uncharacterized CHY-type Zn-finger protein
MRPRVLGPTVDDQTRCVHYRTERDVIAIRLACCGEYHPCHLCHAEAADHPAGRGPRARETCARCCAACAVRS